MRKTTRRRCHSGETQTAQHSTNMLWTYLGGGGEPSYPADGRVYSEIPSEASAEFGSLAFDTMSVRSYKNDESLGSAPYCWFVSSDTSNTLSVFQCKFCCSRRIAVFRANTVQLIQPLFANLVRDFCQPLHHAMWPMTISYIILKQVYTKLSMSWGPLCTQDRQPSCSGVCCI